MSVCVCACGLGAEPVGCDGARLTNGTRPTRRETLERERLPDVDTLLQVARCKLF